MLHMSFVMDNCNVEKLPIEEESSPASSSFSSDHDMLPVMGALLHHQQQVQNKLCSFYNLGKQQKSLHIRHLSLAWRRDVLREKGGREREREAVHDLLYKDYFIEDSMYNEHHFRRRFRMRRHLFLCIMEAFSNHSEYF